MKAGLREFVHPLVGQLADRIESLWQQYLELAPYDDMPADLGYVEGALEGERLTIENRCYQAPQFRKLHLELAHLSQGLDILHCVMFPRSEYSLPIFGTDLVGSKTGVISAAIVDLSPVNPDRSLPLCYQRRLSQLAPLVLKEPRALPEWGDIFSDYCLFARLTDPEEGQKFLQRVEEYLVIHCEIAIETQPLQSLEEIDHIRSRQQNYCLKQQQNDKTRRVLEKSFGTEWTERYMTTMLFDVPVTSSLSM
ncbi:MAG: phycocyanobilin:ferredoxin oxidoreductase [Pseudanabaenaceae cyanobacterium SKYGB_i_bin29]|nr:phycocyanobilin:ferredoxin oxidoreductase [Pseudanabaenaceae cyanobacterium SKYG29]MDW8420745.1 phycocyanobilin:ferredoxin oxidoreductase [Pseudanabaenaceae cyanobacterium SKYGB_i_bin29]